MKAGIFHQIKQEAIQWANKFCTNIETCEFWVGDMVAISEDQKRDVYLWIQLLDLLNQGETNYQFSVRFTLSISNKDTDIPTRLGGDTIEDVSLYIQKVGSPHFTQYVSTMKEIRVGNIDQPIYFSQCYDEIEGLYWRWIEIFPADTIK